MVVRAEPFLQCLDGQGTLARPKGRKLVPIHEQVVGMQANKVSEAARARSLFHWQLIVPRSTRSGRTNPVHFV